MAETVSLRRWSAAIQIIAALVAIAIIARCEPSPISGAASASYRVHRQSSSVHGLRVVAQETLARHPGKIVRSTGPWPVTLTTGHARIRRHIREFSRRGITPASSAVATCYDATAPPALLLT